MLKKILPHLCIIISLMMLTFFVIDQFNSAMAFINNDITKWLLAVYCVLVIATSIYLIADNRRRR